jgi:hypothetical protein
VTAFTVQARLSGFPLGHGLGPNRTLQVTDDGLAHALFVTGRAPGDETRHGLASFWEFVHRASLIPAYVRRTSSGRLTRSTLALHLDRSEKVNLSYALGQAFAAIFCEQVLGASRLLHIDRYCQHHNVVFGPGKQRPDLFGLGNGGWVVAEAKGRSNAMESGLGSKLQSQKSIVQAITGAAPWLRVGTVSEFPAPDRVLRLQAVDPPKVALEPERWNVDVDRMAQAYYEPFLRLLEAGVDEEASYSDDRLRRADLGPVGVRVQILDAVAELVEGAREGSTKGLAARIDAVLARSASDDVGRDGTAFETDWGDSLARRDIDL